MPSGRLVLRSPDLSKQICGVLHCCVVSPGMCGAVATGMQISIRRRRGCEPPVIPEHGMRRVKEVTMTRRARLWITAMLSIAATALMVGLAVAAQAGVNQTHTHPPLAGISFNAID
jgi:hypothetical protein